MTPALPEGYAEPADKAACERIVRLILALGFAHEKVCVGTRPFNAYYEVQCFSLRGGAWVTLERAARGQTEQDATDVAEANVRAAVLSYSRELREAAEAVTASAAQQLAIAADKIARADALDAALR